MLIKIGFRGGSSVFNLGTTSDVQLFFDCIKFYVVPKYPNQDWTILTDRFYRRYLRLDELDTAVNQMKLVEEVFKKLDDNAIDTEKMKTGEIKSDLDLTKNNLFDIFDEYFYAFYHCVESAKINYEVFGSDPNYNYQPVMIAITLLPYSMSYKQIPLSIFDELKPDEKPIWWTGKIPQ